MNGDQMRKARHELGLTSSQMARMLGYQSDKSSNLNTMQRDLENGSRCIREPQRRLVEAYLEGYRPKDWPIK